MHHLYIVVCEIKQVESMSHLLLFPIEGFKGRTGVVTFAKLLTSPVLPKYGQDISGFSMG